MRGLENNANRDYREWDDIHKQVDARGCVMVDKVRYAQLCEDAERYRYFRNLQEVLPVITVERPDGLMILSGAELDKSIDKAIEDEQRRKNIYIVKD